jgi:hypothetical protein
MTTRDPSTVFAGDAVNDRFDRRTPWHSTRPTWSECSTCCITPTGSTIASSMRWKPGRVPGAEALMRKHANVAKGSLNMAGFHVANSGAAGRLALSQ